MTAEIVYMHLLCMFVYPSIDIIEKYEIHLIPNKGYSKKKKTNYKPHTDNTTIYSKGIAKYAMEQRSDKKDGRI